MTILFSVLCLIYRHEFHRRSRMTRWCAFVDSAAHIQIEVDPLTIDTMESWKESSNRTEGTDDFNAADQWYNLPIWGVAVVCGLSLVGLIGNSVVCCVIGRTKKLHNTTNLLIVNLAVADLFVCASSTLKPLFDDALNLWPSTTLGRTLFCILINSSIFMWVSTTASALALVMVSFERFIGIVYPLHYHWFITSRRLKISVILQWCLSLAVEAPWFFKIYFNENWFSCSLSLSKLHCAVYGLVTYIFPIASLVYLYCRMFSCLRNSRDTSLKIRRSNPQAGDDDMRRARQNILINLFIVTVLFILSFTPSMLQMISTLNIIRWNYSRPTLFRACFMMILVNSVVNPLIYVFRYRKFQRALCGIATFRNCRIGKT